MAGIAEAPSFREASELSAAAVGKAADAASGGAGILPALRWVCVYVMMVVIRFLACRSETLRDVRMYHVTVVDDAASPLGASVRIFLPKSKSDPLGSNGGAAIRAVSHDPRRASIST